MAILPVSTARVSDLLKMSVTTGQIDQTQNALLDVENQLSTGKRINTPSDDPGGAAIAAGLQKTLLQRQAYTNNLSQTNTQLSQVDSTLGSLSDLLNQAQSIASANVGSDVTPDAREAAGTVVDSMYSQLLTIGNTEISGQYLFGGSKNTTEPFVQNAGGIQFVGSTKLLSNQDDESTSLPFQVDGNEVFGALATRVQGTADLTPSISASTRISDVRGAGQHGVQLGPIAISDGTTTATVDLSNSDTFADVIAKINAAGVGSITASINATGDGLTLTGGPSDNITVSDVGGGTTAIDLGISQPSGAGAGNPVVGTGLSPKLTELTPLSDLKGGAGIDLASGINIVNGQQKATVQFSSPPLRANATVGDLLNAINGSNTAVTAQINSAGNGIDILNSTQGTTLQISENGGTTAADLGVRSFNPSTNLSDLNDGKGVRTNATGNDIQITDSAGTSFQVKVGGLNTMQDVINAINTAASAAGAQVTAGFATNGNGLTLTDGAAGSGTLSVSAVDYSNAMTDLGLTTQASGGVIQGTDVNPITADGIFGDLGKLRDALKSNDTAGITAAAQAIKSDYDRVVRVRGDNGARVQEVQSRQTQLQDQNTATQSLLSSVQDADMTQTISQFQLLQTSLQASLTAASKSLQLSLLDFLG